jgi:hypothetical protein
MALLVPPRARQTFLLHSPLPQSYFFLGARAPLWPGAVFLRGGSFVCDAIVGVGRRCPPSWVWWMVVTVDSNGGLWFVWVYLVLMTAGGFCYRWLRRRLRRRRRLVLPRPASRLPRVAAARVAATAAHPGCRCRRRRRFFSCRCHVNPVHCLLRRCRLAPHRPRAFPSPPSTTRHALDRTPRLLRADRQNKQHANFREDPYG